MAQELHNVWQVHMQEGIPQVQTHLQEGGRPAGWTSPAHFEQVHADYGVTEAQAGLGNRSFTHLLIAHFRSFQKSK